MRNYQSFSTLAEKLNVCLQHSRGKYIARQDADDISSERRLEKQLEYLNCNHVDFVGTEVNIYDELGIYSCRNLPEDPTVKDFLVTQPYIHPTLMLKKVVIESVGGYNPSIWVNKCEDFELLMRLYQQGFKGRNMKEKLFTYYVNRYKPVKVSYRYRINEAYVRYLSFKRNKLLPRAFVYVLKPLVIGLLPTKILVALKKRYYHD